MSGGSYSALCQMKRTGQATMQIYSTKKGKWALAGVAQLVGHRPGKQRVTGSIPGEGTCWIVGSVPRQNVYKRQLIEVTLSR